MNEKQKSLLITLACGVTLGSGALIAGFAQDDVVVATVIGLLLGFLFTFED